MKKQKLLKTNEKFDLTQLNAQKMPKVVRLKGIMFNLRGELPRHD